MTEFKIGDKVEVFIENEGMDIPGVILDVSSISVVVELKDYGYPMELFQHEYDKIKGYGQK